MSDSVFLSPPELRRLIREQTPGTEVHTSLRELQIRRNDVAIWRAECERFLQVVESMKRDVEELTAGLPEELRDVFWTDRATYRELVMRDNEDAA